MKRRFLILLLACATPPLSLAQTSSETDTTVGNLLVVLRESINSKHRPDETLEFIGRVKAQVEGGGKEVEVELAHYTYIGDMHIRFVFDGPTMMINATPGDLSRLNLTPENALGVALENIRRVYGPARSVPFGKGLTEVESSSPDLISSYFLDKSFWTELEKKHSQGIVAVVPKRGGLLYAPASDHSAVELLKQKVSYLHSSSERLRVSSGVYLYRNGKWSILQAPGQVSP